MICYSEMSLSLQVFLEILQSANIDRDHFLAAQAHHIMLGAHFVVLVKSFVALIYFYFGNQIIADQAAQLPVDC